MGLKLAVDSLDGVDKALHGLYEERDGKFVLALDGDPGFVPAAKLTEFRDSNRKLNADLKAAAEKLKQFDGVDPDEYRKLKESGDDKPNPQATALQKRIEALEAAIRAENEQRVAAEQRLAQTKIGDALRQAAQKIGVNPGMIDDVIQLPSIRSAWQLDAKGNVVAKDGDEVIYGKDGRAPITVEEFMQGRLHKGYLQPSSGGGAPGNNGHPAGAKTMQRMEFDKLPPLQQRDFIVTQKGAVVD